MTTKKLLKSWSGWRGQLKRVGQQELVGITEMPDTGCVKSKLIGELFSYDENQLLIGDTGVEAEFEGARISGATLVGNGLSKVVTAADAQKPGRRRGRQLDSISFLAFAATCNGAEFDGLMVTHKGRSLYPRSTKARLSQDFNDARSFLSSLHLIAWKPGAWPVKMFGTQADVRLAWLTN